ncbi:MAG: SurA N-terminal domain-containing protein [Bauldia sp.]
MLTTLRQHSGGIVTKALMGILVIAFGLWGVERLIPSFGVRDVATVGGSPISVETFQRYYNLAIRSLSQGQGRQLTPDEARLAGIPTLVMNSLVGMETYRLQASEMGLGISSAGLTAQIVADPRFKGPGGIFDRSLLNAYLSQADMSEAAFVAERRGIELRNQLSEGLLAGIAAPEAYARAMHEYRTEKRTLEYLVVPVGLAGDAGTPTDDDLQALFNSNRGQWRVPEYRAVTILKVDPLDLVDPSKVSEADARAIYTAQTARFATPEKRRVRQMTFDDRAKADAAATALQGGKSFDDLIAEANLKAEDVDLGMVTRAAMVNKKAAEAAFSLAANSTSGVIDGDFGPVIVAVGEVTAATTQTFEEAQESIKRDLAVQRAQRTLLELHDKIVDAQSGGETLAEVAKRLERPVQTFAAIDRNGRSAEGAVLNLPQSGQLLRGIFESDVGITNDPLPTAGRGFVWFEVTAVNAARDPSFAEVKDKVMAAWAKEQLNTKSAAFARGLADRLKGGEAFDKIGDELMLTVQTAENVTRETAPANDLTADVINAAFGGKEGLIAVAAGPIEGSRVVLKVTKVERPPYVPNDPQGAALIDRLNIAIGEDVIEQYDAGLQTRYGVSIDQRAVQTAIGVGGAG